MHNSNGPRSKKIPPYIKIGLGRVINLKNAGANALLEEKTVAYNVTAYASHSEQVLPRRSRKYLKIINYSVNPIYYAFDTPASIDQIYLAPGTEAEFLIAPKSSINLIASLANSLVQILEIV